MVESYLYARDHWLKPQAPHVPSVMDLVDVNSLNVATCRMFPSRGNICISPFTDAMLYMETMTKARFWQHTNFYGVDLSSARKEAFEHYFVQPVVGTFDPKTLMSPFMTYDFDFHTVKLSELLAFEIPFSFPMTYTGICHGLAGWFDLAFEGTNVYTTLNTSPAHERTHWYQVRFLFAQPIAVNVGQVLEGVMRFKVNDHRSYVIQTDFAISNTNVKRSVSHHLHEQQYSYTNTTIPDNEFKPEIASLYE